MGALEFIVEELGKMMNFSSFQEKVVYTLLGTLGLLLLSFVVHLIMKKVVLKVIVKVIEKSKNTYDDVFLEYPILSRLGFVVSAICAYYLIPHVFQYFELWGYFVKMLVEVMLVIACLMLLFSFLNALHSIYNRLALAKNRPILGWIQLLKVFFVVIGLLIIISLLFDLEVEKILTGLGAIAAVLLLVFKDTILGLVSSIQLSTNNMLQVGDWVTVPTYNADGIVLEVTLNTVKIQNWDKTISTVPTYAMVSNSFTNWKGMEESGGRRIKRSISINMHTVRFCDEALLNRLKGIRLLQKPIEDIEAEIRAYNEAKGITGDLKMNGRHLTNLGLFRKYLQQYLHEHPQIHDNMTFLVRQLQPTEKGIPIEIYVFSKDQAWANYEGIQADIFDHILACISEFELQIFQLPSGNDLQGVLKRLSH